MPQAPPPLTLRTRAELFTQLGALETAGLPPDKAFGLIRLDKPSQPRLEVARKLLAHGMDPAVAGEKSALFDKLESRLVRAALAAGSPVRVYRRLGEMYTERAAQAASMKSKMMLPGFTLLVGLLLGPLPALFGGSITGGGYVWRVLWPIIVIALLVQIGKRLPHWLNGSEFEESADALLPKLPLIGPMIVRRNARDFFETLGLMLEAGIPMFEALPPAVDTISNIPMRHQYESLVVAVQGGATFAAALQLLPQLGDARVLAFVETGEASGTLPEMLFRHAQMETADLDLFYAQVAKWIPKVIYGLVILWTAWGILSGPGLMSQIPKDL